MSLNKFLENRPLFDESENMSALFKMLVPITTWGKVDWDKIDTKIEVGYEPMVRLF